MAKEELSLSWESGLARVLGILFPEEIVRNRSKLALGQLLLLNNLVERRGNQMLSLNNLMARKK